MQMIQEQKWAEASGKVPNPGKTLLLSLKPSAVRYVNSQRDFDGLAYARKVMITTGMDLNSNGLCKVSQFATALQAIISKQRPFFDAVYTVITAADD